MTAYHDGYARMNKSNGKKYHITLSTIKYRGVTLEMDLHEWIVANPVIAMPRIVKHISPVESASHMLNRRIEKPKQSDQIISILIHKPETANSVAQLTGIHSS
jgi:hypothetical protein